MSKRAVQPREPVSPTRGAPVEIRVRAKPLVRIDARFANRLERCTTVTPNRRFARALEESYDYWKLARPARAWARPSITTLSGFLLSEAERLLERIDPTTRILSPAMQRAAFLSVAPKQLSAPQNWYRGVAQAWTLSHLYSTADPLHSHLQTSNTALFDDWSQAFRALGKERNLMTRAELLGLLIRALERGDWLPERPVMTWGFSQALPLSPAEASLLALLKNKQLLSDAPKPAKLSKASTPRSVAFEQPEDELRAVALWARARLEEAQAPISIGIALPGLHARRQQIERQFLSVLYPEGDPTPDQARVFDLAGGIALSSLSVCENAILLLRFLYSGIGLPEFERLAESPFLRLGIRLPLTNELRRQLSGSISARDFDRVSRGALLPTLRRFADSRGQRRSLAAWLEEFRRALHQASWPGGGKLDSATYQQVAEMARIAQDLARCTSLGNPMRAEDALNELFLATKEQHHEVQRASAPIRILDLEEVVGLRFEHLWVAGMRNADWPPRASANPYLPRQSQRSAHVPDVTPEDRLRRARFTTESLMDNAPSLVFSHARFEKDEQHSSSALLPDSIETRTSFFLPSRLRSLLRVSHPYTPRSRIAFERFTDNQGPPCNEAERRGTASLVRDHSNCPFRSFAIHRLRIEQPQAPTDLPDARVRGVTAHRALEIAYQELPHQESIRDRSDPEALARRAASLAVSLEMRQAPDSLRASQTEILSELLGAWFKCDLNRPEYANVQTEHQIEAEIEGLLLRLKIDRIDQDVKTGKWLIIDYKSSPPAVSSLRDQAPIHEPQLLVYAEALRRKEGRRIVSLAFGSIEDPENVKYAHCSADQRFRRNKADRSYDLQVIDKGGSRVESLIRTYLRGKAGVKPRRRACEHCHLHSLCRIDSAERR